VRGGATGRVVTSPTSSTSRRKPKINRRSGWAQGTSMGLASHGGGGGRGHRRAGVPVARLVPVRADERTPGRLAGRLQPSSEGGRRAYAPHGARTVTIRTYGERDPKARRREAVPPPPATGAASPSCTLRACPESVAWGHQPHQSRDLTTASGYRGVRTPPSAPPHPPA
jgi:hypothetical protein